MPRRLGPIGMYNTRADGYHSNSTHLQTQRICGNAREEGEYRAVGHNETPGYRDEGARDAEALHRDKQFIASKLVKVQNQDHFSTTANS